MRFNFSFLPNEKLKRMKTLVRLGLLFCFFQTYAQVGINTTSPEAQLDIKSSNQATPTNKDGILIPKVDAFPASNPTASQQGMLVYLTTTSGANEPGFYYWDNSTTNWIGIVSTVSGDKDWYKVGTTTAPTAITDDMFHSGKVGIGNSTPVSKLQVSNGSSGITPNVNSIATFETSTDGYLNVLSSGESGILFGANGVGTNGGIVYNRPVVPNGMVFRTNNNQTKLVLTSEGYFGIGSAIPTFPLHFTDTALGDKVSLWGSGANHYGLGLQSNLLQIHSDYDYSDVAFGYGSSSAFTENVRIKGNGNVGIGISNPTVPLQFKFALGDKIALYGGAGDHYGFGIQHQLLQIHADLLNSDIAFGYGHSASFNERMRIKGTGNVGIGTSNPSSRLHIQNGSSSIAANGSSLLTVEGSGTNVYTNLLSTQETGVLFGASGSSANGGLIYNSTTYPNSMMLRTGGNVNRVIVGPTGKVGLGNFSPTVQLEFDNVLGEKICLFGTSSVMYGFGIQSSLLQMYTPNVTDDIAFGYGSTDALVERMRIKGNGNIGIGTSTPSSRLHIQNGSSSITANGSSLLTVEGSGTNVYTNILSTQETGVLFGASGASNHGGVIYNSASYPNSMTFRTGGNTNQMIIGSTGNVGVGTMTPSSKFHVANGASGITPNANSLLTVDKNGTNAYINVLSTQETGVLFGANGSSADGGIIYNSGSFQNSLLFRTGGNINRMMIDNTGNVGIGTTAPTTTLEVNGFTKMGTTAPAVKMIKLTGTTAAAQGSNVALSHGVTSSKILSVNILVEYVSGSSVPPSYTASAGYEFDYYINGGNLVIINKTANSVNILSKPVRVLITYEE